MEYRNIKVNGSGLILEHHHYFGDIIPKFLMEAGTPKHIKYLNPQFILKGLKIRTVNNKVMDANVYGYHPNCDINTGKMCLREDELGCEIMDIHSFSKLLINRLETYYYDDCHWRLEDKDLKTEPVDGFMKIDVNFTKGEIHECKSPFRRLYPEED